MTGVSRMTVEKLLRDLGHVCAMYQDVTLRDLPCKRIQVDEIWSFIYAKHRNVTDKIRQEQGPNVGDIWTWTAIDAETKLVPSWLVGGRDAGYATEFLQDLAGRLANRVQLTSDGYKVYLTAVEDAFGADIDYAMLVKHYGNTPEGEKRYSPAVCTGATQKAITGNPDAKHISTSYVERPEPHDADGNAPFHAPNECFLEEDRQSPLRNRHALHVLQLCANSSDSQNHARDGRWCH